MKAILVLSFFVTFPLMGVGLPAPPASPGDLQMNPKIDKVGCKVSDEWCARLSLAGTRKRPGMVRILG